VAISETKRRTRAQQTGHYVTIYSGAGESNENWAASSIAILIRKHLRKSILEYTQILQRIIKVKMKVARREFNIIGVSSGRNRICIQLKLKQSHYTPRRSLGDRRYSSYSFSTSAKMGVSGRHHAPTAL
jgi:hypothetical protein